jgi:hypothetical protein
VRLKRLLKEDLELLEGRASSVLLRSGSSSEVPMIRRRSKKLSQAGMVCLFSRTLQCEKVWDEPIAGSRLAALHVLPGRLMFWNRTGGQV